MLLALVYVDVVEVKNTLAYYGTPNICRGGRMSLNPAIEKPQIERIKTNSKTITIDIVSRNS